MDEDEVAVMDSEDVSAVISEERVLEAIEQAVGERQPADYRLQVVRQDTRRDGSWWYVVVRPDRAGVRASEYNAILAGVEDQVEARTGAKVLLVPAMPD